MVANAVSRQTRNVTESPSNVCRWDFAAVVRRRRSVSVVDADKRIGVDTTPETLRYRPICEEKR